MSNFAADIEKAAGEPIEAIVIGDEGGWGDGYGLESMEPRIPVDKANRVLTWQEARSWLDREYNTDFGSPSCYAITAWTKSLVIFVSQYDGATSLQTVPRNPIDHEPEMPGG